MREIKYRAWDKGRKEFLSGGNIFIQVNPGANPSTSDKYLDVVDMRHEIATDSRFVLQQYTGLHDKNGKEIYEGDILHGTFHGFFDHKATFFVVWDDEEAGFKANYFEPSECEVIGNVFENPSLLEGGEVSC